jgi:hypothetical protein
MAGTGGIGQRHRPALSRREAMYSIDIFCYAWLG